MKIQSWSLIAGAAAFGIYAVVMTATSGFGLPATFFSVLIAFVAGYFQADAIRFFAGLTLALCCWTGLVLVVGTASERSSAIVLVPVVLTMAFGLGAIAFFAGYLMRRIARALKS
jgi:vacuolar-type H+-ATPase subunit I/STV1